MFYTSDIQDFANKYRTDRQNCHRNKTSTKKVSEVFSGWFLLIQAASKVGDWRVCFNSLQFLRPYVPRTKPTKITNPTKITKTLVGSNIHDQRCEELAPELTAVVRCLVVIQDWIEWSGRKPREEAVLSAIRVLVSKGLAGEVNGLIEMCLKKDLGLCSTS
jgi:hypothetical protein